VALGVALAAGVGAVLRYLVDQTVARRAGSVFPWGTFAVNVSGSFLAGAAVASLSGSARAVVAAGLLGGFTTLSTLAWETLALAEDGLRGAALLNVAGSTAAGLGAAALGLWIG
jgi:fluoride exporter